MAQARFPDGIFVEGTTNVAGAFLTNSNVLATAAIDRSKLAQDTLKPYPLPMAGLRVWNAVGTVLPITAASDDLGLYARTGGGAGADTPTTVALTVKTFDVKTLTTTLYAFFEYPLPAEYDAGETINLRFNAGMETTVASSSATVDVEVFKKDAAIGSDICTTAAQSINNLTAANKDFTITPTGLVAGDVLQGRIAIAVTDAATATAVIGVINDIRFLLDVKG